MNQQDRELRVILKELYLTGMLSLREVAGQFGMSYQTISNLLDKFGIKRRSIAKAFDTGEKYRNRGWLEKMYWGHQLSIKQISKISGYSEQLIWKWMSKLNVKRRPTKKVHD